MIDKFFATLFDVMTMLGCLLGGAMVVLAFLGILEPQAGGIAAIGIGFAVIPYCLSAMQHRAMIRKEMFKD